MSRSVEKGVAVSMNRVPAAPTIIKKVKSMQKKYLSQGATARIKQTGQVVEVTQISDHGVALVKFKTGGQYILLQDRLEGMDENHAETQH
jgi:hypothetical protein